MSTKNPLRWLAAIGAAGILAAAATPASAQAPADALRIYFPDTTVAADGPGVVQRPILYASQPVVLPETTITLDLAGLGGKVDVSAPATEDCTSPSPTTLVCHDPFETALDENGLSIAFEPVLTAAPGAAEGDAGTLKLTLAAPGFTPVSTEARVRVGEPVDLAAGPELEVSAGPGEAFSAPLTVTNLYDTTVDGLNVVFYDDYGLRPATRYRNCTYAGDQLRSCAFDTPIGPGETFTATLPYTVRADTSAPSVKGGERQLMTRAEFEDFVDSLTDFGNDIGTPGDGPELKLVAQHRLAARAAQADVDPANNWTRLTVNVTGKNGTDLAAVGGTLTGAAGDEVAAKVGVANNGPATLDSSRVGSAVTRVDLVPPPGTTVVGVPEDCFAMVDDHIDLDHPERTGASRYRCQPGFLLVAGDADLFEFKLRIDTVIADAAGTVEVNVPCACEGFPRERDLNPANDKAALLVNPTAGGPGGSDGGGPGGSDGGQGGGLPVTGTPIGLIAGGGGVLVLAGVGGYLFARRRRVRFTA